MLVPGEDFQQLPLLGRSAPLARCGHDQCRILLCRLAFLLPVLQEEETADDKHEGRYGQQDGA